MGKEIQRFNEYTFKWEWSFARQEKKESYNLCNPTLCGEDLLTNENEFITLKNIKRVCSCVNKDICYEILRTGDSNLLDTIQK